MSKYWKIVVSGIIAVLVFDTAASFASEIIGFPYAYASIGSIIIYSTIGYTCFRCCGLIKAVIAAVMVELVDATLGWYISWCIGPGALPEEETSTVVIGVTIIMVLVFAVVCSLLGAGLARLVHGSNNA